MGAERGKKGERWLKRGRNGVKWGIITLEPGEGGQHNVSWHPRTSP